MSDDTDQDTPRPPLSLPPGAPSPPSAPAGLAAVDSRERLLELRAPLALSLATVERLLASGLPAGVEAQLRKLWGHQLRLLQQLHELLELEPPRVRAAADRVESAPRAAVAAAPPGAPAVRVEIPDEALRASVVELLAPHFHVAESDDGSDPDVVLADEDAAAGIALPSRVPLVVMTSRPDRDALEPADDYVVKPFHTEELVARVRNLAALRRKEHMLVAALDELRERKRSLDEDLQQARSLQMAMLPRLPPPEELRVEAIYRPADVVGGDLYDLHGAAGRYRFFLADTTGHGLRASLQTMVVKTIWERARAAAHGPADALARLNADILALDPSLRTRLSACCFDIDVPAARLRFAAGGHPPLLLARDGAYEELFQAGPFVGMIDEVRWEQRELALRPGDRLIAFTDGLVEQWSAAGQRVPEADVFRALAAPGSAADATALALRLLDRLTGGAPAPDDITLLVVELPRQPSRPVP